MNNLEKRDRKKWVRELACPDCKCSTKILILNDTHEVKFDLMVISEIVDTVKFFCKNCYCTTIIERRTDKRIERELE